MSPHASRSLMAQFEELASLHARMLELSVRPMAHARVVIVSESGEVDGVESGTRGVVEGVLSDLNGRTLVAVRLDDNGETVYVTPSACETEEQPPA